jgi:leucyl aminopeptidase
MLNINFEREPLYREGSIAFECFEDQILSEKAQEFDQVHQGLLRRALETSYFKGKKNEILVITAPLDISYARIILFGLGKSEHLNRETLENAGGSLVAALRSTPDLHLGIFLGSLKRGEYSPAQIAAHIALGARIRHWRFDKYRTKENENKKPALQNLNLILPDPEAACKVYQPLKQVAEGICLTRELITEPPNVLYPDSYAQRLQDLIKLGLRVEVLDLKDLQKLGMNALLGVAQGSVHEPRVVVLEWEGAKKEHQPLAFVGKGVTFDTGGICLKPSSGMNDMKYDMGGSAVVVGIMRALAGRQAKVNAVGVIGLVENMPSGSAQRPSDVVKSMSGQTIEIIDTDAEGRLVLADVLWYAQDRFKPKLMIDLATLTGAIGITFGEHYAGLFSNDDQLAQYLTQAGEKVGERVWRLPLGEKYDQEINSDIADVKNLGPRGKGGSITAAQFLARFVNNVPWAHLDIASVAWSEKGLPIAEKGATGYGVRLLDQFITDYYE